MRSLIITTFCACVRVSCSYAQRPFSGMELVRRYMDTAGDQECLSWDTGGGVTILQVRSGFGSNF